ncbi:hypothetical protein C4K20_3777 [Pseudomonas chlororaphis subsp. aurantiaca]|nr:hypothetical protein C4K20_3777 [Pseudomonas chlororaphis subsp. aurantiaca]
MAYCQPFAARRSYMEVFMRSLLLPCALPSSANCNFKQPSNPVESTSGFIEALQAKALTGALFPGAVSIRANLRGAAL